MISAITFTLISCSPPAIQKVISPSSTVPPTSTTPDLSPPPSPTPPAMKVDSISPTTSGTAGGPTLTITGSLFQSGATVLVGSTSCTPVTFVSATQLTCPIPARAAGTVGVSVTNPGGIGYTLAASLVFADTFPAPTVSAISPTSGSSFGGNVVTLTGTGFQSGATVKVDGVVCTAPTVVSATSMTCTTPSRIILGAVDIAVQNPDAQIGTLPSGFTYYDPPTFTSLKTDVLNPHCASCHGGSGGFSVATYGDVMTKVTAGDPLAAGSRLYFRTQNGTMPQSGPLSASDVQKIYDWIFANAPNN